MRSPIGASTLAKKTQMIGRSMCPVIVGLLCSISTTATIAAPTPAPPELRLGTDARPLRCALDLVVVPEHSNFTGHAMIELKLARRLSTLWLHGSGLIVDQAHLEIGSSRISVRVETTGIQRLGFALERPAGPGRARLHVAYHGAISDQVRGNGTLWDGNGGLFRRQHNGDWYAATFFAPTFARLAIPCFDEPGFRIPWQVTLHVPREHMALANAPAVSEVDEPGGMKRVRFAETQPLPSYVVAFAVGPFDALDLGKFGRKGTPLRIITPRGRTSEAASAAKSLPERSRLLEDYGIQQRGR